MRGIMSELNDIMALVMDNLRSKLDSEQIFNLWFSGIDLIEMTDEKTVFMVPTSLRKNIIKTRYMDIFEKAIEDAIGFRVDVELVYPNEEEDKKKKIEQKRLEEEASRNIPPMKEEEKLEALEKERMIKSALDGDNMKDKNLLSSYTFDNFIEGSSNKFAKAACYAVAKEPTIYNPLFIHGHSGLGKTHLLYAVINYLKQYHPKLKIVYKKCEDFMNELIDAISRGDTVSFKEKYRTADVLLIDDIQFIAGKVSTQEEFFHTFSTLYENEKQIILTSDRPPKEIKPLEDRLRTRFEGGLIADVQPPSFELRSAIIRKKAEDAGLYLSNELIEYMAQRMQNDIRQIEGVVKKLFAIYSIQGDSINKNSVERTISVIDPGNIPSDVMVERILEIVAKNYGITVENITSSKRTDNIVNARHMAVYMIRENTGLSLKEIGAIFKRDHTTIMSSIDKADSMIKQSNNKKIEYNKLLKELKNSLS